MSMFPPLGLLNRFYLGDAVLLEAIADTLSEQFGIETFVLSQYPELFENHPRVRGLSLTEEYDPGLRVIDMTDSIKSIEEMTGSPTLIKRILHLASKPGRKLLPDKLKRMWEQAGLPEGAIKPPRLYLSADEIAKAGALRGFIGGASVGVILHSRHSVKTWPYTRWLIRRLRQDGYEVFVFADKLQKGEGYLSRYGVHQVVGKSLRELMAYLSMMDVVVGPDTGPVHMAAALGMPTIVAVMDQFRDLWDVYDHCEVVACRTSAWGMRALSPLKVYSAFVSTMSDIQHPKPYNIKDGGKRLGLMLLEGLGGTVTLGDHAKKLYERTGIKPHVVIRKYSDLFVQNPFIEGVVEVGGLQFQEALDAMLPMFETLGAIKTGVGKWYGKPLPGISVDFSEWEDIYERLPSSTCELAKYDANLIQIANKSLGLDWEAIETEIYQYKEPSMPLPSQYVAITNGVDSWHQGLRQTKCWPTEYWSQLVDMLPFPAVQLGTDYDEIIPGAIDLRGKTEILELMAILRDATAIICTEGGLMHLAYAVDNPAAVVLRGPTASVFYSYPGQINVDSLVCEACAWDTENWYMACPKNIRGVCMRSITPERVVNVFESAFETMASLH